MKSCPRCGLVHADADFICRRCQVDLLTGEPVKTPAASSPAKPAFELKNLYAPLLAVPGKISGSAGRASEAVRKKLSRKRTRVSVQARTAETNYCRQCGGVMKPVTLRLYPGKYLYPLLALAAILFGLSFLWRLLLITAGLSAAGFFAFRSLKTSLWKCPDCGHEIKRDKPKPKRLKAG
jgi:hypothetical protein